jgi:hypothetical protein
MRTILYLNRSHSDLPVVPESISQRFARGTGSGSGFVGSAALLGDGAIAGIALTGGLVIGVLIARRYWR